MFTLKTAATAAALGVSAVLGAAVASADNDPPHGYVPEVLASDVDGWLDVLPLCAVEDCSDQPGQFGLWTDPDHGDLYLELGKGVTYLVIDDSAI